MITLKTSIGEEEIPEPLKIMGGGFSITSRPDEGTTVSAHWRVE